ncbi:MAG: hypothetical protein HKN07_09620 [Acidimicrobiia bacterium]|nr:hypothetical protein [Acidimicrobiia bacterium]
MSRVNRVKATKQHQQHSAVKKVKPGKPQRGANFTAQKEESAKKNTARAVAGRKAAKASVVPGPAQAAPKKK